MLFRSTRPLMSSSLSTGTPGRILALALAAMVLALAWIGVALPLLEWHGERDDALVRKQALLSRMESLAASLPEWQRLQADVVARAPAQAVLLAGGADAVASAGLQGLVLEMAARAGARVNSIETLSAEPRGPYRRIALRVHMDTQWPELLSLLQAITEAMPRMLIDELTLRGQIGRAHV